MLPSLPSSINFTVHLLIHVIMFYFTSIGIGMWHMENVQMDAWNREICKSDLSHNSAVITRGTKEPESHGTDSAAAPLETGMSKRMFQIIPVSQNNTMTHKYHLTSV